MSDPVEQGEQVDVEAMLRGNLEAYERLMAENLRLQIELEAERERVRLLEQREQDLLKREREALKRALNAEQREKDTMLRVIEAERIAAKHCFRLPGDFNWDE